jgi:hypothetical protein
MPDATSPVACIRRPAPRRPEDVRRHLKQREAWLREIAPTSFFHALFDVLPGLHFFAKNRRGELMFLSRTNRERYALRDDSEVVGLTDFDINPLGMAQSYVRDDETIYATGEPILNRVELWFDAQGMPAWYSVTKLPIRYDQSCFTEQFRRHVGQTPGQFRRLAGARGD